MVNKLRGITVIGGSLLVGLSLWALTFYARSSADYGPYLKVAATGIVIILLPIAIAYLKLWGGTIAQYLARRKSDSYERGTIFITEDAVANPDRTLDRIADVVTDVDDFDDVYRDAFPEGEGLTVVHTGFHNSFVRVSDSAHLVITGASAKSARLAEIITERVGIPVHRALRNPFVKPQPVRGAPRVFLSVIIVGFVVLGVMGVAGAAYPSSAYNPAEKTVLVGMDARADLDPGVTTTDHRLDKAGFLVDVLEEKEVEVLWAENDFERVRQQGVQATEISADVRTLLAQARSEGLSDEQSARATQIERDLHEAELNVAFALERRAASGNFSAGPITSLADRMREASNTTVREDPGDGVVGVRSSG
ncbi:MAG: hypothetical protein R3324_02865 [Halobacteriales archaeon]|nr:hypothetical protein [Halobacteriales archaeon]